MAELFASPNFPAYFTLAVLAAMFIVFVLEIYPVEVTAMLGAAILVLFGVVPSDGVLEVFSNPAPWTIAAMFMVSGGLVRTGLINTLARTVSRHAAQAQGAGGRAGRRAHRRRVRLHQQHAAGRGDDPGDGAARAQHGAGAVQAADPALVPDGARRHDHHDRHLDQHPGRRRGAGAGAGALPPLRDRAARHRRDPGGLRHHVGAGAAVPAATGIRWPTCSGRASG